MRTRVGNSLIIMNAVRLIILAIGTAALLPVTVTVTVTICVTFTAMSEVGAVRLRVSGAGSLSEQVRL